MTKKKTTATKPKVEEQKSYLKKVPSGLWKEKPRNGVYKLYPKMVIQIEAFSIKNETANVVKIISGEPVPAALTVKRN